MTPNEPEDSGVISDRDGSPAPSFQPPDVAGMASVSPSEAVLPDLLAIVVDEHRDLTRLNSAIQALVFTRADVLPLLAPLLKHPDEEVRTYAALILGERRNQGAVHCLIEALDDPAINVKAQAIESLGKLQSIAAVDPLLAFAGGAEFELAFPAIESLAAIGAERAAHAMIPLLDHPLLGSAAIRAIGHLGTEESVLPLVELLENEQTSLPSVIKVLAQVQERLVDRYGKADDFTDQLRLAIDSSKVQYILSAPSLADDFDRPAFIQVIGNLPGSAVDDALISQLRFPEFKEQKVEAIVRRGLAIVPQLVTLFSEENRDAQLAIVQIFGRLGGPEASTFLYQLLDVDDNEMIVCALQALARMADARLYNAAFPFLDHPNDQVRRAAVTALNALGDARLAADIPLLLNAPSERLQEAAVRIAGYFGFSNCTELLLDLCQSEDEGLCKAAIETLPCFDDHRVINCLASAIHSASAPIRIAAVRALTEVDEPAVLPLLLETLRDPNVWVRYNSACALAHHSDRDAIIGPLLVTAEHDPAVQVRMAAIRSLGVCRGQAVTRLATWTEDSDPDLAAAAIEGLGTFGGAAVVPPLRRAALSVHQETRRKAITALGASTSVEAIEPLFEAAQAENADVAELAITALSHIPSPEAAERLLELGSSPIKRTAVVRALLQCAVTALPALAHRLRDSNVDHRWLAVDVLTRMAGPEVNRLLDLALRDSDRSIRSAALAALSRLSSIGEPDAPKGSG